jgi:hypothetical protein
MVKDYLKEDIDAKLIVAETIRKNIISNWRRQLRKESNKLDEVEITGLDEEDYLEYKKGNEIVNNKQFLDWIL